MGTTCCCTRRSPCWCRKAPTHMPSRLRRPSRKSRSSARRRRRKRRCCSSRWRTNLRCNQKSRTSYRRTHRTNHCRPHWTSRHRPRWMTHWTSRPRGRWTSRPPNRSTCSNCRRGHRRSIRSCFRRLRRPRPTRRYWRDRETPKRRRTRQRSRLTSPPPSKPTSPSLSPAPSHDEPSSIASDCRPDADGYARGSDPQHGASTKQHAAHHEHRR